MNFAALLARVQNLVLKPKEEWAKIKGEQTTVSQLFTSYAIFLAVIPLVAQFLGFLFSGYLRYFFGRALIYIILEYVISLAMVYGLALIINALAPSFGSKSDMTMAMKLAVYSWTPVWVAGIVFLIPAFGIVYLYYLICLLALYLFYMGLDCPLLETPKDKVVPYMAVVGVTSLILIIVARLILRSVMIPSVSSSLNRLIY
jgi:hypothetical protein